MPAADNNAPREACSHDRRDQNAFSGWATMWVVVLCLVLLLVATLYVAGYFQLVVQRGEEYDPVTLLQTTEIRIYSEPWMVHVYWPLAFVQAKISQREIILMSVENGRIIVAE